ncbi:MAG: hydroxyacid dehydrogenase [Alphaproteobacteria bacterium]|nr:hydroxyacid dehydrogenase [Alphaproteobacteria bacterium]
MAIVLIYDSIDQAGLDVLKARADLKIVNVPANDTDRLMAELPCADAAILRYYPFNHAAVAAGKRLKVIQRHGVGYDRVDVVAATKHRIPVATVGEANSVTVAELTLYFMLAAAKQGVALDRMTRTGEWKSRETIPTIELFEKQVLIIGFGRIGTRVAPRCAAFGMRVHVCDPNVSDNDIRAAGYVPVNDFRAALPEMDFVTVHVPLSDETRHMFDHATLARMKMSAVFINTARGEIADNVAVADALTSGKLFAAGFDVFEPEPPGATHPLVMHPRTVITPHAAALTRECNRRTSIRCAHNAIDAIDGRLDPSYVVNPDSLRH